MSYFLGKTQPAKTIKDDDILLLSSAHQSEYLGKNPSLVEIPNNFRDTNIYFVGELICLRPNMAKINSYYLLALLKLKEFYLFVNRENRGQTSHLYPDDLGNIKIPLPPIEVQMKIASEVKSRIQRASQLNTEASAGLENAKSNIESLIFAKNA